MSTFIPLIRYLKMRLFKFVIVVTFVIVATLSALMTAPAQAAATTSAADTGPMVAITAEVAAIHHYEIPSAARRSLLAWRIAAAKAAAHAHWLSWRHRTHADHVQLLAERRAAAAVPAAPAPAAPAPVQAAAVPSPAPAPGGGALGCAGLESLWDAAGGPSGVAPMAASIAMDESGGEQYAQNPSGASGYWQILGSVVPGDIFDPMVNAENAVAKYDGAGDSFAPWTTEGQAAADPQC